MPRQPTKGYPSYALKFGEEFAFPALAGGVLIVTLRKASKALSPSFVILRRAPFARRRIWAIRAMRRAIGDPIIAFGSLS
jgi:hypothetical protein